MKKIAVLGSTGSVGEKVMDIVRAYPDHFEIVALAARQNTDVLLKQAREFRPRVVCIFDEDAAKKAEMSFRSLGVRLATGAEGLIEVSTLSEAEQVIFALVGAVGLRPIFAAIAEGKNLAIANKEPLVMAGQLLMSEAAGKKIDLLPIDSEHSGLWQCLEGRKPNSVHKLFVTTSGGPFLNRKGSLSDVTVEEALCHPKWKMGRKITVDSATLMNKGLEVIEAANLFRLSVDRIEVLVHPEALVHALVEFIDGSFLAQLAVTDMRVPVQYALSYPERLNHMCSLLDLAAVGALHFDRPDFKRFPCLEFGYEAGRRGGTLPAVVNAANEVAVSLFLAGEIQFPGIPRIIERVMSKHKTKLNPSLDDILQADDWAREEAGGLTKAVLDKR